VAFRMRRGESLRHAFKRMARAELGEAREALADVRRAQRSLLEPVHDARTCLNRTRALARLVAPAVGRAARDADDELRAIGRRLSPVRDGAVLVTAFDRVRRSAPRARGRKLAHARETLEALLERRVRSLSAADVQALRARLERSRGQVRRWAPVGDGWRQIAAGLRGGYRRCRRSMRAAYSAGTAEAFHTWRRAVKRHRYQVQALEALWPEELRARRHALETISALLGEEHDLAVLSNSLRERHACPPGDDGCRAFLAALEGRQHELRAQAEPLGARFFAERSARWTERLHAYFRAFFRALRARRP
jgi:CHAD domain-containing protein